MKSSLTCNFGLVVTKLAESILQAIQAHPSKKSFFQPAADVAELSHSPIRQTSLLLLGIVGIDLHENDSYS